MSDAAGSAPDAGNPAGGGDAPAGGGAATQALSGFDWAGALGESHESFKPMLEAKGWKEPGEALKAYGELEKKLGTSVIIPGEDATDEERAAFHKRLGVPDAPDGYQLAKPEGVESYDDKIADWLRRTGHKLGATPALLSGLHDAYFEDIAKPVEEANKQANEEARRKLDADMAEHWPEPAREHNLDMAKRAARFLGFDQSKLDALLDHVSDFALVDAMRKLGEIVGEDALQGGGGGTGAVGTEAARAELQKFKADPAVQKAYADRRDPKHQEVVARFNELQDKAYPIAGA